MGEKGKISVVIAVYNGSKTLGACLHSIGMQSFQNLELIVIDGGSKDNTCKILRENNKMIAYWESKKDNGIYDAWNKALTHVTGEWVCFLGADDEFYYPDAIKDMYNEAAANEKCNYISARKVVSMKKGLVLKGEPWDKYRMQKWQVIAHPGSLHHISLFSRYGQFNDSYKIAADYDFLLRAQDSIEAAYLDKVTVLMGGDGVSNINYIAAFNETFRIQMQNKQVGLIKAGFNYGIAMLKALARKFIY